jgi:hypothetical protein
VNVSCTISTAQPLLVRYLGNAASSPTRPILGRCHIRRKRAVTDSAGRSVVGQDQASHYGVREAPQMIFVSVSSAAPDGFAQVSSASLSPAAGQVVVQLRQRPGHVRVIVHLCVGMAEQLDALNQPPSCRRIRSRSPAQSAGCAASSMRYSSARASTGSQRPERMRRSDIAAMARSKASSVTGHQQLPPTIMLPSPAQTPTWVAASDRSALACSWSGSAT